MSEISGGSDSMDMSSETETGGTETGVSVETGGHMDEYYDKIYTLENGNFVLLYSGEYGAEDNSKVEYGDDGMPVYRYFWENEEVSSEEYERKLNEVYDTEKEIKIFQDAQYDSEKGRYVGNGLCDYQEIIEAIEEISVLN